MSAENSRACFTCQYSTMCGVLRLTIFKVFAWGASSVGAEGLKTDLQAGSCLCSFQTTYHFCKSSKHGDSTCMFSAVGDCIYFTGCRWCIADIVHPCPDTYLYLLFLLCQKAIVPSLLLKSRKLQWSFVFKFPIILWNNRLCDDVWYSLLKKRGGPEIRNC